MVTFSLLLPESSGFFLSSPSEDVGGGKSNRSMWTPPRHQACKANTALHWASSNSRVTSGRFPDSSWPQYRLLHPRGCYSVSAYLSPQFGDISLPIASVLGRIKEELLSLSTSSLFSLFLVVRTKTMASKLLTCHIRNQRFYSNSLRFTASLLLTAYMCIVPTSQQVN